MDDNQNQIEIYSQKINISDPRSVIDYGTDIQRELSDFTSQVLDNVKTKDSGTVGNILTDLSLEVNKLDTKTLMGRGTNFLTNIPHIGKFFTELYRFKMRYQSVEANLNNIVVDLENNYEKLVKEIIVFEELYKKTQDYYEKLDLVIQAGEEKLKELEVTLQTKKEEYASQDGDKVMMQNEIQTMENFIDQLASKVQDLHLTRVATAQAFPQINMVKNGNQALASKIQSAILNTIPLWKRHVTITIGLYNQKETVKTLEKVDETTNELLVKNSELLKENTADVARTLQRGMIDIETLEIVQENLLESIREVREIYAEGNKKREEAKVKIGKLESDLQEKMQIELEN